MPRCSFRPATTSSGTDMHLEFAGKQHLPSHWSLGVVGYWYEQITGDDNNPAILGDFKGRAIALGPEASYQFMKNPKRPVTIDLRRTGRSLAARHSRGDFTTSVGESGHERDEVYGRIGRRPGPDACRYFHLDACARDPHELTGARAVSATTSFR